MDAKLVALKLFLDALDVPSNIDSVEDRKRIQKAVYIGQRSGVDLGYRFGWYIMGPYSPPLTRDYYQLAEALEAEPDSVGEKNLRADARSKLEALRPLLMVPLEAPLSREGWLELVASYDYLRRVSGYTHEQAVQKLKEQKPKLVNEVDLAASALAEHKLLS